MSNTISVWTVVAICLLAVVVSVVATLVVMETRTGAILSQHAGTIQTMGFDHLANVCGSQETEFERCSFIVSDRGLGDITVFVDFWRNVLHEGTSEPTTARVTLWTPRGLFQPKTHTVVVEQREKGPMIYDGQMLF